jgi:hypothetical protein
MYVCTLYVYCALENGSSNSSHGNETSTWDCFNCTHHIIRFGDSTRQFLDRDAVATATLQRLQWLHTNEARYVPIHSQKKAYPRKNLFVGMYVLQGCQMVVYFQSKNPNLGKFWRA